MKKINKIGIIVIGGILVAGLANAYIGQYWKTIDDIIPRVDETRSVGSATKEVLKLWTKNLSVSGQGGFGDTTPEAVLEVTTVGTASAYFMVSSNAAGDGDYFKVDSSGDITMGDNFTYDTSAGGLTIGNPTSGSPLTLGRITGQPSVKATADALFGWLIFDGYDDDIMALNYYDSGDVYLTYGGGNVYIGGFSANPVVTITSRAIIQAISGTNDNLHVMGKGTGGVYSNYYAGTNGFNFCDGDEEVVGKVNSSGDLQLDGKLSVDGTSDSYIQGNLGLGETTPNAILEVTTNSASASSDFFYISGDAAANGNIMKVDNSGNITFHNAYTFPTSDGTANQILGTDGSGTLSFVQMSTAIYAQLSDSTDQTFGATGTAQSITFNTNDEIAGITHSTSSNTENITIVTTGVYNIIVQPQVAAGVGASDDYFHMWLQKDTGGGFADVSNSNVELTLSTNDEDVILLNAIVSLNAGDIIRVRSSVGHTNIELDAQTPASEPAIPSIIFSMFMVGI